MPELKELFPEAPYIARPGNINAWDNEDFVKAIKATGKKHPGAREVVATGQTDWREVVARLTTKGPAGKPIVYQKQMTHHLLPEVNRGWLNEVTNCFLIRDPAEVITSYIRKNESPTIEDLGFVQQTEIFDWVSRQNQKTPPVIDARDVLLDPKRILRLLCEAIGVEFDRAMLAWPPGLRLTDEVWARYWYSEVIRSTSFQSYRPKKQPVPKDLRSVHERCRECYYQLYQYRIH